MGLRRLIKCRIEVEHYNTRIYNFLIATFNICIVYKYILFDRHYRLSTETLKVNSITYYADTVNRPKEHISPPYCCHMRICV